VTIFATRAYRVDRDYAAFFDGSFDLTPELTLSAGLRAFIVENSLDGFSGFQSNTTNPNCIPVDDDNRVCDNFNKVTNQSGETHRINLTWKVDQDRLLYAT